MSGSVAETIDGKEYKLASIKAGQMREVSEGIKQLPIGASILPFNFLTLAFCLQNAASTIGEWDTKKVEDLPWPVYKKLFALASKVSDFEVEGQGSGEPKAAV